MSEQHYWCRVECDARLIGRKLARRKNMGYAISGYGEAYDEEADRYFTLAVVLAQLIAPSREHALSQLISDCPGGVVTTCNPTDPTPPQGRFKGLLPWPVRAKLATPEQLARAEEQIRQVAARKVAHEQQMDENARVGKTDDAAFARITEEFPWPAVQPAYPFKGSAA